MLVAETHSLLEVAENVFLLLKFIEEIYSGIYKLHITCCTDIKGLYDVVNTTKTISDKWVRIKC